MEKELIVNSTDNNVEIALFENKKLVEFHSQKTNKRVTVGDVFLGTVKRLMPGLNAAFVDIGYSKDAFLHYTDLGPKVLSLLDYTNKAQTKRIPSGRLDNFEFLPETSKHGKISDVFKKGQNVLVQILKEPISTKGPRLSCEITIPGRYIVLTPFSNIVAVSKKIGSSDERKRLKVLIASIKPKNFGIIVRTAAEGKKVADLYEEIDALSNKWNTIFEQMEHNPPLKLLSELDKTSSMLRDVLSDSFNRIILNDKTLYTSIKGYLENIAPKKAKILQLYTGSDSIFNKYEVTKQIKSSFGKTATMASGAYLVIEHTEAMHVIDVNSGHKMAKNSARNSIFSVNVESAEEIARQLRLRDIGGLIIVDFIDMKNPNEKKELLSKMRQFMRNDRAQHTILPLSKFGLMQITRQRVKPVVKIDTSEVCPACKGSGKVNATILVVDYIHRDLDFILKSQPNLDIILVVHPFIYAYLRQGFRATQFSWLKKYRKWVKINPDQKIPLLEYKFLNGKRDEIRLNG